MQYTNNPNEPSPKKRIITMLLILTILTIIVVIVVSLFLRNKEDKPVNQNEYHDPASGETVSNPEDREPENFGVSSNEPTYLGFSKLTEYGITAKQLSSTKLAFFTYSYKRAEPIGEVSIYKDSIQSKPFDRENYNEPRGITFKTIINRKDHYDATLNQHGLTSIELILSHNNNEVYRSGVLSIDDEHY